MENLVPESRFVCDEHRFIISNQLDKDVVIMPYDTRLMLPIVKEPATPPQLEPAELIDFGEPIPSTVDVANGAKNDENDVSNSLKVTKTNNCIIYFVCYFFI